MRVLISEDQQQYVGYYAKELTERFGHEVAVRPTPQDAIEYLHTTNVEVAVVDMLYEDGLVGGSLAAIERPTSLPASLITSGLTVIAAAVARKVGIVVWTSGEANRHLHLIFAHERFDVRSICSKTTGSGAEHLHKCIIAAGAGKSLIDPLLQPFLPPPGAAQLAQTILSDPPAKRAVWRAIALGAHSRSAVQTVTGYAGRYVGSLVSSMYLDLAALNLGAGASSKLADRAKFNELVRFASTNRAFFLDRTVNDLYP